MPGTKSSVNSGEGKGDGSIFVNLFCPEQGSTPAFRNPLKQRGKSVSFQIRPSAHFYRNWDIASLPRKLLLKGHRWVALFLR